MSGAFMALKWKHFANVGGFDENFYMYVEDCDLCYRLQHYGAILLLMNFECHTLCTKIISS